MGNELYRWNFVPYQFLSRWATFVDWVAGAPSATSREPSDEAHDSFLLIGVLGGDAQMPRRHSHCPPIICLASVSAGAVLAPLGACHLSKPSVPMPPDGYTSLRADAIHHRLAIAADPESCHEIEVGQFNGFEPSLDQNKPGRLVIWNPNPGPNDPICCPSQYTRSVYGYQGQTFVLVEKTGHSSADFVAAPQASGAPSAPGTTASQTAGTTSGLCTPVGVNSIVRMPATEAERREERSVSGGCQSGIALGGQTDTAIVRIDVRTNAAVGTQPSDRVDDIAAESNQNDVGLLFC